VPLNHWPTLPTLVLSPVIAWAYYRLAVREERIMVERFGDKYRAYRDRAPMILPRDRRLWRLVSATRSLRSSV